MELHVRFPDETPYDYAPLARAGVRIYLERSRASEPERL